MPCFVRPIAALVDQTSYSYVSTFIMLGRRCASPGYTRATGEYYRTRPRVAEEPSDG